MWNHRYGFVCLLAALTASSALVSFAAAVDTSTLPLIQFADLQYIGAFRLPRAFANGDSFSQGGNPVTFNPSRNSLYVGSRNGNLAEVSIPPLVVSNDINQLRFSSFVQGFFEPTEGTISQINVGTGPYVSGLLVHNDVLYGNATVYYDANNLQRVSHFSRSKTLGTKSVVGMKQVWADEHTGFVSGYMAMVPPEWQAKLGGPAVTGQCCIPIAWRTSWGPSAFAWNPPDMYTHAKVPATPLLYYAHDHHTLGHWQNVNTTYSASTQITGLAILAGTRTALYFGRNGTGPFCYGTATSDLSLVGKPTPDGAIYCYDPYSTAKGTHGYPYNYQIWAYDLNDLAAVRAGTKQPWEITPYGVWPFGLPYPEPQFRIGGIGYDPSRQIIYVSQEYADQDVYEYRPIIHAFKVNGGAVGLPLPPPDTTPLPPVTTTSSSSTTGNRLTALALTANKTAPQPAGTPISFSAAPTGGVAPHQYKWLVHDGLTWIEMAGWSTSSSFNWTPSLANSQHRIGVWVRSAGNTADVSEFTASMDFPIGNSASWIPPYAATTAVGITANKAAPQPAGSMITWTAAPTGGTAPHQYKWMIHNGVQWSTVTDWSTSNTFTWTPAIPNSGYRIGAWARSAGATVDAPDATTSADFPINGTATSTTPAPAPTPTPSGAQLTAVSLTANKAAPQPAGTTVTFSAAPNGGAAPHQYKWLVHNGVSWTPIADWSTSNTFDWTPASSNAGYRVGVWVKNAGVAGDTPQVTNSMDFPVSAGAAAPPPPTTTTTSTGRLTAVSLTADKPAPQPAGTSITFTSVPTGGATPHQYKWLLHNGLGWSPLTAWTTSNAFTWTPPSNANNPAYRIGVWVRSAGLTADTPEMSMSMDYPITAAVTLPPPPPPPTTTTTSGTLTAVSLTANKVAPQPAGTTVTFSAAPNGGVAPHQYKWLIHNGQSWTAVTSWTTSSTFNWTPTAQNSSYRVGVWVRNAGVTTDAAQATMSVDFPVSAGVAAPVPPPPSTTAAPLTAVSLTANKVAPQVPGVPITFTAVPNGGAAPHSYKWLVHNGVQWSVVTDWATADTFTWTPPATANASSRIGVWVRTAGKTADVPDVTMSIDFPIWK